MNFTDKKCPMRRTAEGDFLPCIGKECAAYGEYLEQYVTLEIGDLPQKRPVQQKICYCKMFATAGTIGGCT